MTPIPAAALRALVTKWRDEYARNKLTVEYHQGMRRATILCADELAAVLTRGEGVEQKDTEDAQLYRWIKYANNTMLDLWSCCKFEDRDDWIRARIADAGAEPAEPLMQTIMHKVGEIYDESHPDAGTGEMLRCPFCHSANTGIASDDPEETTGYGKCHACGARGPVACDNETIVASWNRRAADGEQK